MRLMVLTESLIFRTHNSANSWENDGCFPDLRFLHITRTVLTCLLRFCEARNVKTSGELVGVDTLLLDGQSSLIQASVSVHQGAMYELSGFDVTRSNNRFKLGDSAMAIWLNKFTNMVEVRAVANLIPTEMFMFRSVDQLMSLANTNAELPDIIGEVSDIRTTYNDHTQTIQ
ncbi:hypothetical protein HID58_034048 [Brassica napus]|uniref:Uncharacterized protein n=3 Tax=Brassica TaxID=3705 RepID=A0ABQ8C0Y2_BRANA|nr:hypothetical protein HID58_034048 [Brassica napus]